MANHRRVALSSILYLEICLFLLYPFCVYAQYDNRPNYEKKQVEKFEPEIDYKQRVVERQPDTSYQNMKGLRYSEKQLGNGNIPNDFVAPKASQRRNGLEGEINNPKAPQPLNANIDIGGGLAANHMKQLAEGVRKTADRLINLREKFKGKVKPGAGSVLKLAERPECVNDVEALCSKTKKNNFQILDCLQSERNNKKLISEKCQNLIYEYKTNLTLDIRFDTAAENVCKDDMFRLTECENEEKGTGKRIPCLIEHKENVTKAGCRQFLAKMASIIFSDYRLVCDFKEKCKEDIDKLQCGRMAETDESAIHAQGEVIECLSSQVTHLGDDCKHEILRVAELQSDDFQQDRALYYACKNDRESFCSNVVSGSGKVYKCLFKHKFDRAMSTECRKQLTRRQQMMAIDVKVNRGLFMTCKSAIRKYQCFETDGMSKVKEARQATILMCLEGAIADGKSVEPECVAELKETRRALMEDFKISPNIVQKCDLEIRNNCGGGLDREGKTLHCLMDLVRNKNDAVDSECKAELERLIVEANPVESLSMDPVLQSACGSIAQTACKGKQDKNGNVVACLMELLDSDSMTDDCEERLLEIQYFVARDFSLDPALFRNCQKEAETMCGDTKFFHRKQVKESYLEDKAYTFSCLYSHYKEQQLSRGCSFEVRRVLRQRAISVELNPRIQEPCLNDLASLCLNQGKKGQELKCLQDKYESLEDECKEAMEQFIEDKDKDIQMDKIIMRRCTPMIKKFCSEMLENKNTEPGDVMQCLIEHKTNGEMDGKCRAGIEHHQLISLKDYKFSYKFKEACKDDVLQVCKSQVKTKAEVVKCLSEAVRNDTLKESTQRVSANCRSQLTFQLLQRSENIDLDPLLKEACNSDIETYCGKIEHGSGRVLECLKKHEQSLQSTCRKKIFKREKVEAVNAKGDFFLFKQCKRMIKTYCSDAQPGQVFKCLREHKNEHDFDKTCKKAMLERMRERAKDVRLNVNLMKGCKLDIAKFCKKEMLEAEEEEGSQLEGKVMECLKVKFAQKRLSESCEDLVSTKVKEAELDYKQDPILSVSCRNEINQFCQDKVVAEDLDDHGQVQQCLRLNMLSGKIANQKCLQSIARSLAESKVDVHVDPLLYKACAVDIKHYCQGVPRGEGRQMSCLLSGLDDKHTQLTQECRKMLSERREMWEKAAEQAPPETLNEVLNLIVISPSHNYMMTVLFVILACIFVFGCCCGRVSKRVRREMKNR